MTKDQLSEEVGKLKISVESWESQDRDVRKYFARILNKTENKYVISNTTYRDLSWHEIFCEVGKLLAKDKLFLIDQRISHLEDKARNTATC